MSQRTKEIKEISAGQALNHYRNAGKWPCRKPGGGEQDPLFLIIILLILLNRLLIFLILLNRLTGDWA